MFRNYFVAAIRNLFRDRAYAGINICGLALGFAAVILIGLYVRDELSYDRQWPASDRLYMLHRDVKGAQNISLAVVRANFAKAMELDFPEVEFATRLATSGGTMRYGNKEVILGILWADPNFFRMFPPHAVAGDPDAALSTPDGLVVTRTLARRLFNREDVVGEQVLWLARNTLRVAAVIEDPPPNSHLIFEAIGPAIASFSRLAPLDAATENANGAFPDEPARTYIRLRPGADVQRLRAQMTNFVRRHAPDKLAGKEAWQLYDLSLIALPDLHFSRPGPTDLKPPTDRLTLRTFMITGFVILFVAASNFVSMMTARSARRAIEVGVRKVVGATRRQLVVQFLGECLFYSGLALGIAILAVELALPGFNGFLQKHIAFDFVRDPSLGAALLLVWLLVGLAAGAYPALVLSMFRPISVLKGMLSLPGGPGRLRQAMVVVQFGALIALIVATLTIHRQTRFAMEEQLRVPGEQLYVMPVGCLFAFKEVAAAVNGVRDTSCTSGVSLSNDGNGTVFYMPNGSSLTITGAPVDDEFFAIFGIEPVAGRLFDDQHGEDNVLRDANATANPSIVLNESAARVLGYANPADAVGQTRRWSRFASRDRSFTSLDAQGSQIVGIVPDVPLGSVRTAVLPTAYYIEPRRADTLVIKLDGRGIPETMRALQDTWAKRTNGRVFPGQFMDQIINGLYVDIVRQTKLFAAFSAVAIVVAALGLLGLAVFTAQRRTREIGLRKVMGASRSDILRFISWQFARPVMLANLIAWPCAWFVMQGWLEGFAYHVNVGVLTLLAGSALALAIALITVTGHALLVARSKPVEALRYE